MMRLAGSNSAASPLASMNQMRLPTITSPITSMASSLAAQQSNQKNGLNDSRSQRAMAAADRRRDNHIKKPLNAFMWFMKENRPRLMEEQGYKERQSAELNKELGRRVSIRYYTLTSSELKIGFLFSGTIYPKKSNRNTMQWREKNEQSICKNTPAGPLATITQLTKRRNESETSLLVCATLSALVRSANNTRSFRQFRIEKVSRSIRPRQSGSVVQAL